MLVNPGGPGQPDGGLIAPDNIFTTVISCFPRVNVVMFAVAMYAVTGGLLRFVFEDRLLDIRQGADFGQPNTNPTFYRQNEQKDEAKLKGKNIQQNSKVIYKNGVPWDGYVTNMIIENNGKFTGVLKNGKRWDGKIIRTDGDTITTITLKGGHVLPLYHIKNGRYPHGGKFTGTADYNQVLDGDAENMDMGDGGEFTGVLKKGLPWNGEGTNVVIVARGRFTGTFQDGEAWDGHARNILLQDGARFTGVIRSGVPQDPD